jgi:hypothetical protein
MLLLLLEVMDKELTVPQTVAYAVPLGLIGFLAARWRAWLALPVLAILVIIADTVASELADSAVRAAILQEAGPYYAVQVFGLLGAAALATLAGAATRLYRRRRLQAGSGEGAA